MVEIWSLLYLHLSFDRNYRYPNSISARVAATIAPQYIGQLLNIDLRGS